MLHYEYKQVQHQFFFFLGGGEVNCLPFLTDCILVGGGGDQQSVRRISCYFLWPVLNSKKSVCVLVLDWEGSWVAASS